MAERDDTMDADLRDAAKEYLVRYGGDVFPNLFRSAKGTIVQDSHGREYLNIRRRPERGSVWRIAPPLTVSHDEIDRAVAILSEALGESLDEMASGAAQR